MASNYTEWYVQLIHGRSKAPIDDDTGQYAVLSAGTGSPETIYKDDRGSAFVVTTDFPTAVIHSAIPQPITMTNGVIRFFTANSVTSVDITGITANGYPFFIKGMVPSQHRHVIWPNASDVGAFALPYVIGTNTGMLSLVVDSGWDLPAGVLVRDAYTDILVAATLGGLSVGTSTTVSGFLLGALNQVTSTGLAFIASLVTIYGSLLAVTATATRPQIGYRRLNATSGARLVYACTTITAPAGSGLVYLRLERLPTRSAA